MLLCGCLYYDSTRLVYSGKVIALLNWWNVPSCMARYKDELYRCYSEPNVLIWLPDANHINALEKFYIYIYIYSVSQSPPNPEFS